MAKLEPVQDQRWSELIGGIVADATRLFSKEIELAKLEIRQDLISAKTRLTGIITGATLVFLGTALLCVAVALALFAYTTLPQWACFGIVGGVILVAGLASIAAVNRNKRIFDFIPQRTAEAIKEDIGWINSTIRTSSAISQTASKPERR